MTMPRQGRLLSPLIALLLPLAILLSPGCGSRNGDGTGQFTLVAPEDLPDIPFQNLLTGEEQDYLGIRAAGDFTLGDIGADVLLLEFLNVQCPACQRQSPILRKAYQAVRRRKLDGRIKFLAVTAGNTPAETAKFKKEHKIPFPMIADPTFRTYGAIGRPGGLPYLLIVTLRPPGGGERVSRGHDGMVKSAKGMVAELQAALEAKSQGTAERARHATRGEWQNLPYNASETYVARLLQSSAAEIGIPSVTVEAVALGENDVLYRLQSPRGKKLWAKVAGRVKICNLCHDIFFIVLFDDEGTVVNYTSINVTKTKNLKWDARDNAFMKGRLIGRSLRKEITFDPAVDAVTTATMSSALIVDTVRLLGDSYRALVERGLVAGSPAATPPRP